MPETLKNFEEVDAHLTRIFEMQNLVESPDGTRITLGQFIRNKLAEKDIEIARLRATQPPQAAVGEGELPKQYLNPERWERSEDGEYMAVLPNGEFVRWYVFEKMREAYREAIAQRDEARETIYWLRRMGLLKPNAEAALEKHGLYAEAKLAALDVPKPAPPQGAPDFNKWWHGDNSAKWSIDGKERRNWKPLFESTWKAALAALDVPKPEEIERPPCPECGAPMGWKLACVCGFPEQPPLGDKEIESLRKLLLIRNPKIMELREIAFQAEKLLARYHLAALRLRSLPSESEEIEKLYFIQDTRTTCGNAVMWWKPDGNGYTSNVNEAWRVPKEKADQMHRNRSTDVAWPVSVILGKAFPIFDFQNLRSIEKDK